MDVCRICVCFVGPVVAVQEGGGEPQEALANCYQPPGNKGTGAGFREVLFHLHGEYHPVGMLVATHGTTREASDGFSRNLTLEDFCNEPRSI
jgi:hypothetical protein